MSEITDKQLSDYEAGKAELKEIIALGDDYFGKLEGRAQFFLDGGHDERALIMLEMLEELDRTDKRVHLLAIDTCLKLGRSDAAEEKIEALLERNPEDPEILVAKAEMLIQTGHTVAAATVLGTVIEADPQAKTDAGKRAQAVAARAHAMFEA